MQKNTNKNKKINLIKEIKFNSEGLVPVITQDYKTKDIFMLAYMNKIALSLTLKTGIVHYYSRSRNKIWKKGETSGNIQKIKEIFIDCDGDCILLKIVQIGNAACHTGYKSCFYRKFEKNKFFVKSKKIFEPGNVYRIK